MIGAEHVTPGLLVPDNLGDNLTLQMQSFNRLVPFSMQNKQGRSNS